jgi:alkylated DNA repair dioxygenase AlkB
VTDDERGRITSLPRFIDAPTAEAWFTELRRTVDWRSETRLMYEKEVDVPRLMSSYRLDPAPAAAPACIVDAAARVSTHLGVPFNSVGLNLYRDGRDSVAPHNDRLKEICEGAPIALLSLGATRRMTVRAKAAPPRVMHVDLEAGSLFVMDYATQLHYTHAVPKTTAPVGERISLAFRLKPSRARRARAGIESGMAPPRRRTSVPRKPQTLDEYSGLSPEHRAARQRVRRALHAAAPGSEACLSCGMPAFRGARTLSLT